MEIYLNDYKIEMLIGQLERLKKQVQESEKNNDEFLSIEKAKLAGFKTALACMGILEEDLLRG